MTDQFLGEIRMFAGNFAPTGWAFCDGQLIAISQNTALFALLGTMYGGDGKANYALPNLQGCTVMNSGSGPGLTPRMQGETSGAHAVTLTSAELPVHTHQASAASGGGLASPENAAWGAQAGRTAPPSYSSAAANIQMSPQALAPSGGSQPHNNLQPYLAVNFIIALQGIFPSRQ